MPNFQAHPGYLFVLATLLPLASFLLIFLASGLWCILKRYRSDALEVDLEFSRGGTVSDVIHLNTEKARGGRK